MSLPELTYFAVDKMILCEPTGISPGDPIVVSSITDARHLDRSTTLGNLIADFARTRLAHDGMQVMEPRLRSTMLLRPEQGEMMLGRNPYTLVSAPAYSAVLTGTYGVGDSGVLVSLKLIRADNGQILAGADFVARRTADLDSLLGDSPVALAR